MGSDHPHGRQDFPPRPFPEGDTLQRQDGTAGGPHGRKGCCREGFRRRDAPDVETFQGRFPDDYDSCKTRCQPGLGRGD